MKDDEIINRIKRHYLFFRMIEEDVEDKNILKEAKKYMELLFFELLKCNIRSKL